MEKKKKARVSSRLPPVGRRGGTRQAERERPGMAL